MLIAVASANFVDVEAAPKKTKAKTSVSSKKKKKTKTAVSTPKKKTTSTGKKKTIASSKSKSKTRGKVTKKSRKATNIVHKQYTPPADPIKNDSLTLLINSELVSWIPQNLNPGGLRVNSVTPDHKTRTAKVALNENFTYLPVSKELVTDMRRHISSILPDSIRDYYVALNVKDKNYSFYITTIDKLPEKFRKNPPFVVPAEPYVNARRGMEGDIIAMWPSHGRYYKPATDAWLWQRPQLFQVTEDTHTMSFILPYVVPMLENAGAYVLLPRERDINKNEVIIDNDTNEEGEIFSQPYYKEMTGSREWTTGEEEGFIYDLPDFRDTENPFENGTYRQTTTVTSGKPSVAAWYADIPEDGEYAVYVSYKTLPNSTEDAHYTVNFSGGTREFKVNQTMGGGTWIYLGTFPFEAGYSDSEPVITLSNLSKTSDKVLTADAVKIGGGMGNIARSPNRSDIYYDPSTPGNTEIEEDSDDDDVIDSETEDTETEKANDTPKGSAPVFKVSGLPRYLEGARYWMQWAGIPEYIYSPYHGKDDYKDDYTARGHWVNYLAGGSRVLPDKDGLNIPVDAAFALHSDAGKRADDSFIGTLGIYYTNGGDQYVDGTPRSNSRTLTDMVMRQMVNDIRQTWEPNWTRRSMWDKSYVEARVPEVPTTLIEFMSHQNFADMWYALDPAFRFTVSRSIYKAIGQFVSERKDRKFVVQPLPVKNFSIDKVKDGLYRLAWAPQKDRLETSADPNKYLVFERSADELGFHLLGETSSTHFDVLVSDNEIHSFKIVAANEGGISFPSEILALREGESNETPILIVNGFTRVSGPEHFSNDGMAGFQSDSDFGVPYINDISFIGFQTEFNRNAGEAFGRSNGNYASKVIAGNTFDFPYIHGEAMMAAGKGFVSASVGAVENGSIKLNDFKTVDLILGRQKATITGNGNTGIRFSAFSKHLQNDIKSFLSHGGNLFVSGEYVASDLADYRSPHGSDSFASDVLGVSLGVGAKTMSGTVNINGEAGVKSNIHSLPYSSSLNEKQYIVQSPDILIPSGVHNGKTFLRFSDTGESAGIVTENGKSHTAVMSIPFETIKDKSSRNSLMKGILDFFDK